MTFTIFAGQSFTVYLDRVGQAYSSSGVGSSAQTLTLSDNISIIAVQSTRGVGDHYFGMIASTTDSDYILTNSSWKCTGDVTNGDVSWTSYYFNDDDWKYAVEYESFAVGNVQPKASWIWTYHWTYSDAVVRCRRRIGELTIAKHCIMIMMIVLMNNDDGDDGDDDKHDGGGVGGGDDDALTLVTGVQMQLYLLTWQNIWLRAR